MFKCSDGDGSFGGGGGGGRGRRPGWVWVDAPCTVQSVQGIIKINNYE